MHDTSNPSQVEPVNEADEVDSVPEGQEAEPGSFEVVQRANRHARHDSTFVIDLDQEYHSD